MYSCKYSDTSSTNIICIHAYMCIYIICLSLSLYIYIYIHRERGIHVCIYIYMYICIYIYICIHIHTPVHTRFATPLSASGGFRKRTNRVCTKGVTAHDMLVDRGTCWVLPFANLLVTSYFSRRARAYLFSQHVKLKYFCSGPI